MGAFATFSRISNHPSSRFLRAGSEEFNGYRGRGREYGLAPHIPGCSLRLPLPRLLFRRTPTGHACGVRAATQPGCRRSYGTSKLAD